VKDVNRRASPLLLAVHEVADGGVAYLSVFASADWPTQLVWRRVKDCDSHAQATKQRRYTITEKGIAKALMLALNELIDYAGRCGFKVNFAWP
jgi:hypothetical protein